MAGKRTVDEGGAFMPHCSGNVEHPSGVGRWKNQHIKRMAVLLVCVGNSIGKVSVLLDLPLYSVRRHALRGVTVGAVDYALATGVSAQPEDAVVQFGD